MPTVPLKHIYYVSSEDKNYPASNLLSTGKKWKCKENGEKSIYIIFELAEPTIITGIDIGNEHSAYVQVLVNKKGGKDSDYEELLLTSSFMTPLESRNSKNPNRVRCFSDCTLVDDVAENKWNLVKVICTQPYNKHVQYGLSLLKLHSGGPVIDSQSSNSSTGSRVIQLGKFTMREESPDTSDSESLTSTSLFSRWKNTSATSSVKETAASEIKKATTSLTSTSSTNFINRNKISDKKNTSISLPDTDDDGGKNSKKARNMNRLFYDDNEDEVVPNERLEKKLEKDKLVKAQEKLEREKEIKGQKDLKQTHQSKRTGEEKMKNSMTKFKTFLDDKDDDRKPSTSSTPNSKPSMSSSPNTKPRTITTSTSTPATPSNSHKDKDRNNSTPKRQSSSPNHQTSEAKKLKLSIEPTKTYKPFNKLMEGITLAISGIQNPERADLRQKALDMGARYKPDWDNNCTHLICAFKGTPKYNHVKQDNGKIVGKKWIHDSYDKRMKYPWRRYALDSYDQKLQDSDEEIYDEKLAPKKPETVIQSQISESDSNILDMYDKSPEYDSGEDTEEEIERVKKEESKSAVQEPNNNHVDQYDKSTDEDESLNANSQSSQIGQPFYKGIKFHLNTKTISSTDLIKLKHLIKVYHGELSEDQTKSDFIVSNKPVIRPDRFTGEVIKPLWIFECHDMESKLPIKRYKFDS